MDHLTYYKRSRYLLEMISKGRAASPHEIAERFNCSEKTVRNMINRWREEGMNIIYDKKTRRYRIDPDDEELE